MYQRPVRPTRKSTTTTTTTTTAATTTTTTTEAPTTTTTTTTQQPLSNKRLHMIALNFPLSGRMGGIVGADRLCFEQAKDAGLRGTYRAFLSSRDQHVSSIVRRQDRENVPIVNAKGEILFPNWNSIFNGSMGDFHDPEKIYSFEQRRILTDARWPVKAIWHGSSPDGSVNSHHYCVSWYTQNMAVTGAGASLRNHRLLAHKPLSCHRSFAVLCIENSTRTLRYRKR
ncbi:unnamed protein product [Clavelina lepadiformis]|uniref:Collagenase NC10/endostatin domain-containing protein n=1 Tax=Clavelina lepadiformis TaxID=159417 RepID=A0ABP0F5G0_CLALP